MNLYYFVLVVCFAAPLVNGRCTKKEAEVFRECPRKEIHVKLGQSVVLNCKTEKRFDACMWKSPENNVFPAERDLIYQKLRKDNKDCSFKIHNVTRQLLGKWDCDPLFPSSSKSVITASTKLVHGSAAGTSSQAEMLRVEMLLLCVVWLVSSMLS